MTEKPAADETIAGAFRQVVRSPEQVTLDLPVAGPTSRMLAYVVDGVLIVLLEIGLVVLTLLVTPSLASGLARWARGWLAAVRLGEDLGPVMLLAVALLLVLQVAIEWSYFVFWEMTSGGRSPGKLCVGLRVVRDGGFPIGLRESLVRNLLRMVDLLPAYYAVGLIAMVISREGKRLGDIAAGTIVVRLDRPAAAMALPERNASTAGVFRFERGQIDRVGVTELALARETLRRLATLPPARAEEALERTVTALCRRLGHAPVAAGEREAFLHALLDAARMR